MPRIVHFEIPYDDGNRLKAFCEEVFGWRVEGWGEEPTYQLASTGDPESPGIDGALYQRQDPDMGVMVYVDVESIDASLEKALAAGASQVHGKQQIPGVGWSAVVRDPEGNHFGLFQSDEPADG